MLTPLTKAPYYVLTMGVCAHGSFGGYKVDTEYRVLDIKGEPILNFYAAGEVACGSFIYDDYLAGGCGLNFAYTSGRFSGANAATVLSGRSARVLLDARPETQRIDRLDTLNDNLPSGPSKLR